jgi:Na+/H+ antiporter NhaD/arsenite permease-like protein
MPSFHPVLLSDARILAAYLIFFGSYFVFALGKFPWMKIDRPGAAIIGAVLMVAFGIVGAQEALASIDFSTIVLLFSMMLVVANLRVAGFFERLAERLIARLQPHHLLPTVIATCGLLSAVLVPAVMVLRTLVAGLPDPHAGWLTLAMASTLAGNLTITGSVANIIVVERAAAEGVHIGFREYARVGLPLTIVTLVWGVVWLAWVT